MVEDPYFRVEVISKTPDPQRTVYAGMHQDYSEDFVWDTIGHWPNEKKSGEIAVNQLLKGGKGHFGPCEAPQIVFNCGWFPHSTMQQARTHRVGISFDVQSSRYTGKRIIEAVEGKRDIESVFYLRPSGDYTDRQGKKYFYSEEERKEDLWWVRTAAERYALKILEGQSEEHARGTIPFDVRQHWVLSANLRTLMHFLVVRGKPDAQLEIQALCQLMLPHFKTWAPEIYEWFEKNLWLKGRLAP